MLATVDVHWKCPYKRLYEMGCYHMLLALVRGGMEKAELEYAIFGAVIETWTT